MDLVSKSSRKASVGSANAPESKIDSVLTDLIDQLSGVSAAMLFDADGFALSGVIRPGGALEPEAAEAAAMGASLIGAARRALAAGAGSQVDAPVRSIWVRNDRQNLYCVEVGEAAYAVVTAEPEVPAGLLMFRIDKWAKLAAQAIDSLSLTIPEQLAGSDSSRAERKLLAVEVPADRIGRVRVGVPNDIVDRDADQGAGQIEAFEPYVRDEDVTSEDRAALYAHGAGLAEAGLAEVEPVGPVEPDLALAGESFDLAEAIAIELVAEAETEAEAELQAEHQAELQAGLSAASPAEATVATGSAPRIEPEPFLGSGPAAPAPAAPPQEWSAPAPLAFDLPENPERAWQPGSSGQATDGVAEPIAVAFSAGDPGIAPVTESPAGPAAGPAVGPGVDRAPIAPKLSDDWVIMETAATPAVAPPAVTSAPLSSPVNAHGSAPAQAPAPAPMALADTMGDWLAPSAPAAATPVAPAPLQRQAAVPVAESGFPPLGQARAPQGNPVSFDPPPTGFGPVPPAWMAPAPVAARAPMAFGGPRPVAPVSPPAAPARPAWNAPAPEGRPVAFGGPPPGVSAAPAQPAWNAPAPEGRPVAFGGAPPGVSAAPARPAWNAPAPAGSPVMVAPPPMAAPVSFDPPPLVYTSGESAVSQHAHRPMAPRPATAVWSPSAPDELDLDRADVPSWGAYGNPNPNPNPNTP